MREQQPTITFSEVIRAVHRQGLKATAVFMVICTIALFAIVLRPPTYQSEAKLYMRVGRENVTLDPTATTGQTVSIYQTRSSEMNSTLEILGSRRVAEHVVSEVGAASILADENPDQDQEAEVDRSEQPSPATAISQAFDRFGAAIKALKESVSPSIPETAETRAIRTVLQMTSFSSPKESSVIELQCQAGHPRLAQAIIESWTTGFLNEYLRITSTEGSLEFFDDQVRSLGRQLIAAEQQLTESKVAAGLVSVPGQQGILERQIEQIRTNRVENDSALAASKARLREMLDDSTVDSREINPSNAVTSDSWDRMRERLFELQIQESELKSRFLETHPLVTSIVGQRKAVAAVLEKQADTRLIQQSIRNERAIVAALEAEKEVIDGQLTNLQAELQRLNDSAMKIAKLQRTVEILDANYRAHFEKLEEARIQQSLDEERISSVNILQPASFVAQPTGPGKSLLLLLGVTAAVLASGTTIVIAEFLDRSLKSALQVEQLLEIPVLVSIPRTSRPRIPVS